MTKIQDKITYYDGSVATGKIVVTWPPFDYGGMSIAAGQQEYPIAPDGSVVIECYPCVGAQPVGTYYTATYDLDKGAAYDEYWMVPATSVTTIGAIRVSVPATPSIMINAQQLTSGGASSGMFLGWNGSNWVPMYVSNFNCAVRSFFGRIGDVMPLTGDYTVDQVTNAVPDARKVIAGAGLSGGGPLTADVTISLSAGGFVPPTTQVIAGPGLIGGGPLTGDVTLSVLPGTFALQTTHVIAGSGLSGGGPLTADVTLSVTAGAFVAQTTRVIAGTGLTGGGPLSADVTLALAAGTAVPPSTQVIAGAGLTGGGPLTGDVTLAVVDNSSIQKLQLALAGVLKATRHQLNFVAGSGVNLNLVDDGTNDQGTLTITAVATGAPTPSIYSVNGVQIGSQVELNLIASTGVTLVGVNNNGAGRVDVTVSTTGSGAVTSVFTRTGAVIALAADYSAFYVPLARQVLAGTGLSGGGALSADVTLAAKAMVASGASHSAGMVPDPGATAGLTKFLREDATWVVPAYPADAVSSVFTRTGAVVALATDYAAFYVPLARQVIAGTGLSGGGALSADVTLTAKAMVASGASHSAGMVPDPGATAGVTRFLREDATWVVPPNTGGTPAGSTGQVQFNNAGAFGASANLVWDITNSRLGIGRTPEVQLDVSSTILTRPSVLQNPTSGYGLRMGFDTGSSIGDILCYNWTTPGFAPLSIRGSPTTFMGGNVGIGVTNPGSMLEVAGNIRSTNVVTPASGTGVELLFSGGTGYVVSYDRTAGAYHPLVLNQSFNIIPSGYVGIGTSVPRTTFVVTRPSTGTMVPPALGVTGNSAVQFLNDNVYGLIGGTLDSGNFYLQVQRVDGQAAAYHMLLQSMGGYVGIGTAGGAPNYLLSLGAALGDKLALYDGGAGAIYGLGIQSGVLQIYAQGGQRVGLGSGTSASFTETMSILGSRVGVGTIAPGYKIHMYGVGQAPSPYYWPTQPDDATLYLQDAAGGAGNGGAILFGSAPGPHCAIRGYLTNGGGPQGDLVFYFRPTAGDSAFYEKMRIDNSGNLNLATGQFRLNGQTIASITGWSIPQYAFNQVYQNNQGKPVFISFTATLNASSYLQFLCDGANPPSFIAASVTNQRSDATVVGTVSAWVLPGFFYRFVSPGATWVSSPTWA